MYHKLPIFDSTIYKKHLKGLGAWFFTFLIGFNFIRAFSDKANDRQIKSDLLQIRRTHGLLKIFKRKLEQRSEIPLESM